MTELNWGIILIFFGVGYAFAYLAFDRKDRTGRNLFFAAYVVLGFMFPLLGGVMMTAGAAALIGYCAIWFLLFK